MLRVIDVSDWQQDIDWATVKNHIDGAIIRCGWGKDLEKQDDVKYHQNVQGCIDNAIPFGIFLFSYAKTIDRAKSEAQHVLRLLEPYKGKLAFPVYLDLEKDGTQEGAVERAKVFADILEKEGYMVGMYANEWWWKTYLKDGLDKYTKWVAKYKGKPEGISGTYDMWQYSSKGSVPGINGRVDVNECYRDFPKEYLETQDETKEGEKLPMNTYRKGVVTQLAKNFKSTEFDCNGKGCCTTTPIDPRLVEVLQNIRDHFGVSVNLNCAYRCVEHNSKVSGASKNSQHLLGKAADIVVKGVHPMRVARYIETIQGFAGRIGCYTWDDKGNGFVHVDVRGKNSRGIYTDNNVDYDSVTSFSKSIKRGAKGRSVRVMQRKLKSHGMYNGEIDGKCGGGTERGIIAWNAAHGRPNDVSWGPKCWNEAFPI